MHIFSGFIAALLFLSISMYAQPATAEGEVIIDLTPIVTKLDNGDISPVLAEHKGEVVVLNIWATWCVPCVKELPDLLKLRNEYKDQGLVLVLLSLDDIDELDTKVYPFLIEQGIRFETYIRESGDEQAFINGIDESWSGAIPLTLIYDRKGNKNTIIYGSKHYDDFEKYVKPLL